MGQAELPGLELPDSPDSGKSFRPIHYLGSKLRLVEVITEAIDRVARPTGIAIDLFSGSATVAHALGRSRNVTAVDIQEYSRVLASAVLTPPPNDWERDRKVVAHAKEIAESGSAQWAATAIAAHERECLSKAGRGDSEPLCQLLELGSLTSWERSTTGIESKQLRDVIEETWARLRSKKKADARDTSVLRYFGGPYFSYSQAAGLDALLEAVDLASPSSRDFYLAAVLSTASDIVNTIGRQFAQPIRLRGSDGAPKAHLVRQVTRDRSMDVLTAFERWLGRYRALELTKRSHRAIRADYRDFLATCSDAVSVIYADPPYTRDHYSRFYHVLETMCLRDNPAVSTMRLAGQVLPSRGSYRLDRHQSPFCIKSQASTAFEDLFLGARRLQAPLVVSYSPYPASERARPRVMTLDELKTIASRHFSSVEVTSVGPYSHNKFNERARNSRILRESEVLLICRD